MEAKNFSYAGLVTIALALLPIIPAQVIILKELMAVLTLILGIVARMKGDKHGGLLILVVGVYLIISTIFADYVLYLLSQA